MNENEICKEYDKQINKLYYRNINRLNKLDENFNQLKNILYKLTQQYENNKSYNNENSEEEITLKEIINSNEYQNKINEIFKLERENNINFINENFQNFLNKDFFNNQNELNELINNTQIECNNILNELNEKLNQLKNNKENTINTMINEMNIEFQSIQKLIKDNELDLLSSNNDRAQAIQNMLKIFLNKFKNEKKEKIEFEEKITKLLEELLDKMLYLKNKEMN